MTTSVLHCVTRPPKSPNALRKEALVPAVLYGHGVPTSSIAVDRSAFLRVWKSAGESSLIDLELDDRAPVKAIIHDLQFDPRTNGVTHIDFHQVKMTEKVQVDVELEFTGEAPAVKELGGTLVKVRTSVPVECLPADLVKAIPVEVTALAAFDDAIHIRDLVLPKGLTVLEQPDDVVASVERPRTEEELASLTEQVEEDVSKVEQVEKPKGEKEAEDTASDEAQAKPK